MLRRYFPSVAVILVIAALFVFLPRVYNNQSFLFNMMLYLALAEGLNIIYGFTGYLPFGYVGFFGAGAYGSAIAITLLHISPYAGVLIGGVAAVLTGIILIPLLRLSGAYFAIANLAASQALYLVVANPSLQNITQGPYGIDLSSIYNANAGYYTMLVVLVFAMLLVAYMKNSDFGLSLLAIKEDRDRLACGRERGAGKKYCLDAERLCRRACRGGLRLVYGGLLSQYGL